MQGQVQDQQEPHRLPEESMEDKQHRREPRKPQGLLPDQAGRGRHQELRAARRCDRRAIRRKRDNADCGRKARVQCIPDGA